MFEDVDGEKRGILAKRGWKRRGISDREEKKEGERKRRGNISEKEVEKDAYT